MLLTPLKSLFDLFFPHLCFACQTHPPMPGSSVCVRCDYEIVPTDYHLQAENPVLDRFWGRVPIEAATSFFHFSKGGLLQQLIHELKYNNRPEIGIELGKLYGHILAQSPLYQSIDCIVPVPLHPKKELLRGYNQAAMFAQGLAEVLECPWTKHGLIRQHYSESQTKKSREERFQNVSEVFVLPQPEKLRGKHILLVDDVITTGATLEACALRLLEAEGVRVSVASIALASI